MQAVKTRSWRPRVARWGAVQVPELADSDGAASGLRNTIVAQGEFLDGLVFAFEVFSGIIHAPKQGAYGGRSSAG